MLFFPTNGKLKILDVKADCFESVDFPKKIFKPGLCSIREVRVKGYYWALGFSRALHF